MAILLVVAGTEGVDDVGNVGVVGPKLGFQNLERLQAKRTRARVLPLSAITSRLCVEPDG